MHVAIEAVGARFGGGATVLRDLVAAALAHPEVEQLTLFCSPASVRRFPLPASPKLRTVEQPWADRSHLGRLWWLHRGLPKAAAGVAPDVLLCFNGMGSGGGIPTVAFIQQSLPFSSEVFSRVNLYRKTKLLTLFTGMRACCRRSRSVIVQTPCMADTIRTAFRLEPRKVTVHPASVPSPSPQARCRSDLAALFDAVPESARLLYAGSDSTHKNLPFIAAAMNDVRKRVPGATLFVTLKPEHPLCNGDTVVGVGYVHSSEVAGLYRKATALVMASLIETVGLPLAEAMTSNLPILAADRPYARDVCGPAAAYFDPLDRSSFVEAACAVLSDSALRARLVEEGYRRVRDAKPTDTYGRMVDTILASAAQSHHGGRLPAQTTGCIG